MIISQLFRTFDFVEGRLHLNKTKKMRFYLVLYSICTTFELRSNVLSFEKSQINLDFYSLIRTFAG